MRPTSTVAVLLLIAAACSSPGTETSTDVSAVVTPTTAPAAEPDGDSPAVSVDSGVHPDDLAALAFIEEGEVAADDGTPAASPSGGGTPSSRPAAKPATARPGIERVDPLLQYRGTLGILGIDQPLEVSPAAAPARTSGTAPLTGLPGGGNHRAVVVKIDNSSKARPQLGLNNADIVFEEEVEWGITRLAAVFHSNDAVVGPVRSGRSTDIALINSLGGPALAYSGANDVIDALLLRQTTVANYSADRSSAYWRDRSRSAPSNMFTDSASFTSGGSTPPAQFAYGSTSSGTSTSTISVNYPTTKVRWSWDGASWLRNQDGSAHTTDGGAQVSATNVVVVVVREVDTGLVDSAGGMVPEYVFAGTGPASVFTGGQRINGTWTRPSLRSPAVLVDNSGTVIKLNPGRTWVELVVAGGYSSS